MEETISGEIQAVIDLYPDGSDVEIYEATQVLDNDDFDWLQANRPEVLERMVAANLAMEENLE